MLKKLLFLFPVLLSLNVKADNKITYYFNQPVDNSVSTGVNAVYINNVADTLCAYINRAKYTIDIAQYDYIQSSSFANIATAINNAYSRGVQVRWICDGSEPNNGLASLNPAINTLNSPTSSHYGIMHNKFMIVDGKSTDAADPIVWTGSFDWSSEQFNTDYNNAIILQDSALAQAYTAEFNMMWGDTGVAPNRSLSKFGPDKTDLGSHMFTVDGNEVELYFSPSDGTDTHIQSCIASANTDMYFGVYTFTDNTDALQIVAKQNAGVYVAGIDDEYSVGYSANTTLAALGSSFIVYNGGSHSIYHSKFMIADPSDACSDPQVLTGSHNWTTAANTKNDENTLIVHSATAANVYYQSFSKNFTTLGGTLSAIPGCTTGVGTVSATTEQATIFPNPSNGDVTISYQLSQQQPVTIEIFDILGQKVVSLTAGELQQAGSYSRTFTLNNGGMYFVRGYLGNSQFNSKLIVTSK